MIHPLTMLLTAPQSGQSTDVASVDKCEEKSS